MSTPQPLSPLPKPNLRDPVQFLAFGFGSGMAPRAPGTVGTVAALPVYAAMNTQALWVYSILVLLAAVAGIAICERASRRLNVHDHPGIVWDEFVGLWIALWAVPMTWTWVLAGFLIFRFFDIFKPWPIGWLDRHADGGFGIMIDDIVAGVFTCALLQGARLMLLT